MLPNNALILDLVKRGSLIMDLHMLDTRNAAMRMSFRLAIQASAFFPIIPRQNIVSESFTPRL